MAEPAGSLNRARDRCILVQRPMDSDGAVVPVVNFKSGHIGDAFRLGLDDQRMCAQHMTVSEPQALEGDRLR